MAQNEVHEWNSAFVEKIYMICSSTLPGGMKIDTDAVEHLRDITFAIVTDLLELRPSTAEDIYAHARKMFAKSCMTIPKEAYEAMTSYNPSSRKVASIFNLSGGSSSSRNHDVRTTLNLVKSRLGVRELHKRDREREKELEKISVFLNAMTEYLADDVLRWAGNFVRNLKNSENKISLLNLRIAMCADRGLMELTSSRYQEEEERSEGWLSSFCEYRDSDEDENVDKAVSYTTVAHEFLKEEQHFIRELRRANVFRRRIESRLQDEKIVVTKFFGNLPEIHELTLKMERVIEDAIEMSEIPCIGLGFWELCEAHEFDVYLTYLKREIETSSADTPIELDITQAVEEAICQLLEAPRNSSIFQDDDKGFGCSLNGETLKLALKYILPMLLYGPFVHFFRYMEYTTRLLRHCNNDDDRFDLQNCYQYLSRIGRQIECFCSNSPELKAIAREQPNRSDSAMAQISKLQDIERHIDGFTGTHIAKTCTELIKEGTLQMVRPSFNYSPDVSLKGRWLTTRHVYIFDQMVLLCKRVKNMEKFNFKERCPAQLLEVVDMPDTNVKNSFQITFNDPEKRSTRVFTCNSIEEKNGWMYALVRITTSSLIERILSNDEKEEARRIPLCLPTPEQYRFAEPDTEDNISFEDYTSSSGVPVIKSGTVLKLVERLTYPQYTDSKYVQLFMISYRSFCSPSDLLNLLIERFDVPTPAKLQPNGNEMRSGPYDTVQSHGLSGGMNNKIYLEQSLQLFRREYQRPVQRRVLLVFNQWVKNHWYDFANDSILLGNLQSFLRNCCDNGRLTNHHKKTCANILKLIDKMMAKSPTEGHTNSAFDFSPEVSLYKTNSYPEVVWHTAKKGDIDNYDLLTLHPLEVGRQLTLLHFDLYRAIKPIELVGAAWTKHDKAEKSPQLLKLTDHSTKLTYWVSRSIVETDSLEERVALFNRVLEVMSVFEELHNFTGLVAFRAALHISAVHRLSACWERLDSEKQKCLDRFESLCDTRGQEMQRRLSSINPPCVPFFGHYLTNIVFFEAGNTTFIERPKDSRTDSVRAPSGSTKNPKVVVSFFKCRRISELIRDIQMYQNQPYPLQNEPSIRQFFESINPKSDFNGNDDLESYLFERSQKIQPKDGEKMPDAKPKHPPHVLKSPGIKPPKANHYSSNNHRSHTVPSTPSFDDSGRSTHSALTAEDIPSRTSSASELSPKLRNGVHTLMQPPRPPKGRASSSSSGQQSPATLHHQQLPSTSGTTTSSPPPLYPRRIQNTPPVIRSPRSTPRSADDHLPTFVFPSVCESPPLPPRTSPDHTPTVSLSVPLPQPPPPPPPPRGAVLQPPPLPPKNAPPLPPKTYKTRQRSGIQNSN